MTYDQNNTIAQFLDGTAARQPVPGGGSVTALAGALAAAIGEMVVNYSIGKKGLEAHQEELRQAIAQLRRARQVMVELMIEDQNAYQALSAAQKLPESSVEYRSQYPATLLACIRAPQAIAVTAAAVLDLCDRLVDSVNLYLLSDLAVCAELAMATVRCGTYNVRVNLRQADPASHEEIESGLKQTLARATGLIQEVIPRIWQRYDR